MTIPIPKKERPEYLEAIREDISWLGFKWDQECYASSYFDKLHEYAVQLIEQGQAYVCSLNAEQVREYRGTLKQPGRPSPDRDRSVEDNLRLFEEMRQGKHADGVYTLRAKIDMASGNMNMRDPAIYRIRHTEHHRLGDKWCIYPMYDWAHGLSDAIEGISHSLCSLEFQDHRPLYDWILEQLGTAARPQQIEFARLRMNYLVVSKRYFTPLIEKGVVDGWDDPRMPTLRAMRRLGYPPQAIRSFCDAIGVSKSNSVIDYSTLEEHVRGALNSTAKRAFAVLDPLKVVLTNYPEDKEEMLDAPNHPQDPGQGTRKLPFAKELFIEASDFLEDAPKKFFRLAPEREVRLRYGYVIKCESVIKDDSGKVTELHCSVDFDTLGKNPVGRKVKGIIHWVSAKHAVQSKVRVYDRLFAVEHPDQGEGDMMDSINENSLQTIENALLEPSLKEAAPEQCFQFERLGYFCADRFLHKSETPVFNRTVTLKDTWGKLQKKGK